MVAGIDAAETPQNTKLVSYPSRSICLDDQIQVRPDQRFSIPEDIETTRGRKSLPQPEPHERLFALSSETSAQAIRSELERYGYPIAPLGVASYRYSTGPSDLPLDLQYAFVSNFLDAARQITRTRRSTIGVLSACMSAWISIGISLGSEDGGRLEPILIYSIISTGALLFVSDNRSRPYTAWEAGEWLMSRRITDPVLQAALARQIKEEAERSFGGWRASNVAKSLSDQEFFVELPWQVAREIIMASYHNKREQSIFQGITDSIRNLWENQVRQPLYAIGRTALALVDAVVDLIETQTQFYVCRVLIYTGGRVGVREHQHATNPSRLRVLEEPVDAGCQAEEQVARSDAKEAFVRRKV